MGKQVCRQIYPTDNGACMLYVLEGGGGPGPLGPILDPPLLTRIIHRWRCAKPFTELSEDRSIIIIIELQSEYN